MNPENNNSWLSLLLRPDIPADFSAEALYRAAGIGAVTLLYEFRDASGLAEAARYAPVPEMRARALFALERLTGADEPTGSEAVRRLYEMAILDDHREARDFLSASGVRDRDPGWFSAGLLLREQKNSLLKHDPELTALTELFISGAVPLRTRLLTLSEKVLPHWQKLMRYLDEPSPENHDTVLEAYHAFSPVERKLVRYTAGSGNAADSLAADLFLRYEDADLRELCLMHDIRPSDPSREALFFFLSGQWERYYASDSDYRRIRVAYEENDPELQRRLITVSRDSGNNAWLRSVGGSSDSLPNSGTLSDQHLLTAALIEQRQWQRLWELLPTLPMLCMPEACRALDAAGFIPGLADEAAFFAELKERIAAAEGKTWIPLSRKLYEGGGTAVEVTGGGSYLAVLFADRRILVWDRREPDQVLTVISSNQPAFRHICLSHDGKYLCADCGKDGISLFSLPGGRSVKTIPAGNAPLSGMFLQTDDRRMITLDRDGAGKVYSFPSGTELFRFDLGLRDCVRASYDAESGRICGITQTGECMLYDPGEKRLVAGVGLDPVLTAFDSSFSRGRIAFLDGEGRFCRVNLLSGKTVHRLEVPEGEGVRRMLGIGGNELFVLGDLSGKLRIFDPEGMWCPQILSMGAKAAVTGLWFDEKERMLYGCGGSGAVRCWDLGLFMEMTRVIPLLDLPGFNRIDDFSKKYPEPGVKAAGEWMKTVVGWRRRFDIEVDFDE